MGRYRKPNNLKRSQGTFREDRAGKVIEMPELVKPECPTWLDDAGKATWERVTAVMADANMSFDVELLSAFCDCYSHLIKCSEKLRSEGYTLTSDSGLPKINPTVNALRELQKTLIEASKQLGLSIESRAKMGLEVKKQEEVDAFEEFLKAGRKS